MLRTLPVAALFLLVACGGSKNAPTEPSPLPDQSAADEAASLSAGEDTPNAPLSAEDRASVDRLIGLTVELLDTLEQGQGDCDKVATSMNSFLDQHGGEIKSLTEHLQNSPESTQAAASRDIEEAVEPKMANLVVALSACQEHEGVIGAFERLQSL